MGRISRIKQFQIFLLSFLLLLPIPLCASFIEATMGTAVVNDATATYNNPAALILLKNPQFITLGSVAYFRTQFTGQFIQPMTGFMQAGSSSTRTHYFLPSFYLGMPITKKVSVGLAVISNSFNKEFENTSILRYAQANNSIRDTDLDPAIGIKLNEFLSLGIGISLSHVSILLQPISGFPSLNIPDSQSRNESSATSWGGDVGILLRPARFTLIGFNYRSAVTYQLSGKSVFEGHPRVSSNHYHFKLWTPARSVFSISQFVTSSLGLLTTIQYIQWNIFKDANIHGIATQIGFMPVIVPNATVHYHFHNSWVVTLGSQYRITPKWIIRAAGSYVQSPTNANYQIANGDSIIIGASMGYEIYKNVILDGSYAHVFFKNQNIHIANARNIINGVNSASRDAVSLKLTFNIK